VSWLVYLSESDCAGGIFRAFCRPGAAHVGAHDGNLQVAWLDAVDTAALDASPRAVFLDAWVRPAADADDAALCALYALAPRAHGVGEDGAADGEREYLTAPISTSDPTFAGGGMDSDAFVRALQRKLIKRSGKLSAVSSVLPAADVVDVEPTASTLVLFDSVSVPHAVLATSSGVRLALAGWFHEAVQEVPDWYGRGDGE